MHKIRERARQKKQAAADVAPVRQRSQYTCMSTSMMMCLQAQGVVTNEDEVNKVMGARPMMGAAWEQALACAQHYGMRATLTVPATVKQLKNWTDQGIAVMIAWNPENREWSHASVVFDVDDDLNVHIADPNIPDPDETVRVMPKAEFYGKWFEKASQGYLIRRPAMAVEREITMDGKQVMASAPKTPLRGRMKFAMILDDQSSFQQKDAAGCQDIYPNEIDHGYEAPLAGGSDVMQQLQNQLLHEQGNDGMMRAPNHRIKNAADLERVWFGKTAATYQEEWDTYREYLLANSHRMLEAYSLLAGKYGMEFAKYMLAFIRDCNERPSEHNFADPLFDAHPEAFAHAWDQRKDLTGRPIGDQVDVTSDVVRDLLDQYETTLSRDEWDKNPPVVQKYDPAEDDKEILEQAWFPADKTAHQKFELPTSGREFIIYTDPRGVTLSITKEGPHYVGHTSQGTRRRWKTEREMIAHLKKGRFVQVDRERFAKETEEPKKEYSLGSPLSLRRDYGLVNKVASRFEKESR